MKIKVQKKDLADQVLYEYEGEEISRDLNSIVIEAFFTRDDMPFMEVVFKKGDLFIEYYYTDRWYNIFEIHDRDNDGLKGWYCNIGKPAVIEEGVVSYVDLALDLWVSTTGEQTVLDADEFEAMGLDDELRSSAIQGLSELKQRFLNNKPPV